ncbi:MAG: hypothetical protein ACR2LK_16070 [Solirubrobacteraceae bacterium]
MFTITIIFALLVALWGFSSTIASRVRRALASTKPQTPQAPAHERAAAARSRGSRPVASA